MKKKIVIFALVLTIAFTFAACSNSAPAESGASESVSAETSAAADASSAETTSDSAIASDAIDAAQDDWSNKFYGVSVIDHSNPFYFMESDTIKEIVEAEGSKFASSDPANDVATQVRQISEMIAGGIDVLIVDPIDSEGIEPALVECEDAGIPVIIINSPVANTDLAASIIVSDNVDAGRQAGRLLCEAIGVEGEIAIVGGSSLPAVRGRTEGLKEVIETEYPYITIVADRDANGTVEDAKSITDTFLPAYPDLKGIFAVNDSTAQGVAAALQGANKTDKIFVAAADGFQNEIDMIKAGQLISASVRQPALIGAAAVDAAKQIWAGETPEKEIIIPVINITIENWEQFNEMIY